jgi:hypothetical protein
MRRWLRSELPLVVVVVYLPRIQILVGRSWAGTTLKGWPFGLSGRGSQFSLEIARILLQLEMPLYCSCAAAEPVFSAGGKTMAGIYPSTRDH